jgi:hypothetical protein
MPDPHRIERELREILSQPRYSALLAKQTQFREKPITATLLAKQTAERIRRDSPFDGEVTVDEVKGGHGAKLYRGFDGIGGFRVGLQAAMTQAAFWCDRDLVENIWDATAGVSGPARDQAFFDFLRAAMFVHPEWNRLTDSACMSIPAGNWVPVVKGTGSWRSMRQQPGRKAQIPQIRTAGDVIDRLGWMPIPGPHQYLLPLVNDMAVNKGPRLHLSWPLWT